MRAGSLQDNVARSVPDPHQQTLCEVCGVLRNKASSSSSRRKLRATTIAYAVGCLNFPSYLEIWRLDPLSEVRLCIISPTKQQTLLSAVFFALPKKKINF